MAIHWVGWVCVCAPVRESLYLLWRETHTKAWARDLRRDRKWRSQKGQKGSWWRKTERGSWQQSAEGGRKRWKQGREGSQQKSERRLLRPDDLQRGRVNQCEKMSAWLVAFVEVSRKIHASDSLQMHGECKVSLNSLSCAWSWPKSILFVCSFPPTLSVVFYVAIMKCVIPPAETTRRITGHE